MKKLLSAILTICLVLSCTAPALAAAFPDLEPRHAWAEPAIEYMVSKGIIDGYEDDTFRPDRTVTRAEFIKMLDETFGLSATAAIPYTDVPADQWYAPYVKKAVAQGYLLNYGTLLNPNGALSRQEAMALLVRYLDPDESLKAPTTTFTDYSSIKVAYRDYVLLAAGIGLINGYEDDTFRPDKTLNRVEALAILYRAAGTICNDNLVESEAGAGDKNAVIIKNNITVTGAEFEGRVIISEGVSGGIVTLNECIIGELIVRGTAKVNLSGCSVDSLIVDSSAASSISMLDGSTVKDMTLRTSADINMASRTTLTKLTVEKEAVRSSLSGSGVFSNAVINATGFVSEKIPTNYTLAKGVSATFADKVYTSGSTPSAADTGFSTQPTVYAASSYTYLTLTPAATGTVYYYYTNTESVPTAALFDNYYAVAASRSSFAVTANRSVDTQIGSTSAVGTYSYVVVRFTDSLGNKYQPVVISNRASDGFTVAPTVTTTGNYQYLSYTPAVSGSVFYYYTNSSAVPTVSTFTNTYVSSATSYSGELTAVAGQAANTPTVAAASVSGYAYVAVMMMDNTNKEYQPILVAIGGSSSASSTGFTVDPYCNSTTSGVTLGFTPTYSGTVDYYFSRSATVPTASQFETNKSMTLITLSGSTTVSAGVACNMPLLNMVSTTTYPYIVVRLKSSSGMAYAPVVVRIDSSSGNTSTPGAAGSGFTIAPTVSYDSGKYTINFQAMGSGTLYYYLTNNPNSPGSMFMDNFNMTTSTQLAVKLGGTIAATGAVQTMPTILSTSLSDDYAYMAIMFRQGSTTYTPVIVSVPDAEAVVIQNTGFIVGPSYNTYQSSAELYLHQIELCTATSGTVWYYYTDDNTVPKSSDVIDIVMMGSDGITECGYETVVGYQKKQIALSFNEVPADYVVLMFTDNNNNHYLPLVLSTSGLAASSNISSGFAKNPTVSTASGLPVLEYITMESGKVYYFFTNNSSNMSTMWDFFSNSTTRGYFSASADGVKGVIDLSVGKGSALLTTTKSIAGYTHVAILFQSAAGEPGGYRMPLVLPLNGTTSSGNSNVSNSGFSDTPYLVGSSVYYVPSSVGTVYYGFTQTDSTTDLYGTIGALGSLGALGNLGGMTTGDSIASYIATVNYGSSQPVLYSGVAQSIIVPTNYFTLFKYIALWTVNTAGQMTTPVFVSLGNSFSGGLLTGGSGFSIEPQYTDWLKQISFTPSATGQVVYFYTNSNTSYNTHSSFVNAYNEARENNNGTAGAIGVSAGQAGTITVTVNNLYNFYKYVWIYMYTGDGTYTPVRLQLY